MLFIFVEQSALGPAYGRRCPRFSAPRSRPQPDLECYFNSQEKLLYCIDFGWTEVSRVPVHWWRYKPSEGLGLAICQPEGASSFPKRTRQIPHLGHRPRLNQTWQGIAAFNEALG